VTRMYTAYKNVAGSNVARLLDSVTVYWKDCAAYLFNNQYKLWWRDGTKLNQRTSNGSPVLWSGCNAWAIAGLARVLQDLPADYKDRPYFVQQFKDVCDALRKAPALGSDGLWRTSLLDYNQFPDKESIASAFFGFAFTWGINNGLLDKVTYEPYLRKTWSALVKNIGSDGRLQWSQGVSDGPGGVSQSFSAAEGEGAFMLAAEELAKMLYPTAVIKDSPSPMAAPPSFRIKNRGTSLVLFTNANPTPAAVFDVRGRMVGSFSSGRPLILPGGIYIAKAGSHALQGHTAMVAALP
jgi:hypothetical protein